jgi:hypothetical protein
MRTIIAAAVLVTQLCNTGCAPTTYFVAAVHQSQPMHGLGPKPIGDNDQSLETTYEALEAGCRWQRGAWFAETSLDYVVHDTDLTGGPWIFTSKIGWSVSP